MKTHEEVLEEWNGGTFLAKSRVETIAFLRNRYGITKDDAEDLFQESAIALFHHIKEDELELKKSSLSSYFKSICINQTLKFLRDNKGRHDDLFPVGGKGNRFASKVEKALILTRPTDTNRCERDISMMWYLVKHMTTPCKEILWGFYYDDKELEEIAKELNKDKNVVKVRKAQCLSKLRTKKHLFE